MDKKDKKVVTLNTIKNKLTRERLWQQIKHKKKLEKKERRTKKQEQRKAARQRTNRHREKKK